MLRISNMVTEILTSEDTVRVVDGLSLTLNRGEICALVGESGCGKSMTAFSLLRLLPSSGRVSSGVVTVDGTEIMGLPEAAMRNIRSFKISLIFQEPATSLNPVMTVGDQIVETILLHTPLRGEEARAKALDWLKKVGIPEPERRMKSFPFELSGGQKQRVMIAIALAAEPNYLIADEPTTALDVTIQSKILELIQEIQKKRQLSVIYITHDLGVVAKVADYVNVMYAGKIVASGTVEDVFYDPLHPYTWGLLSAMPDLGTDDERLYTIPGSPPNLLHKVTGDAVAPRNKYALNIDSRLEPPMFKISETHSAATWLLHPKAPKVDMPPELRDRIERMKKEGGIA